MTEERSTFASRLGTIFTLVGVAVGLGNVWRFPYLVGQFGGAAFVLFYVFVSVAIGVPGLMAEWALGRSTRRGTLGAFERGGLPGGKAVGIALFCVVIAATAYYTNVVGWVLYFTVGELASMFGAHMNAAAILPPQSGFDATSLLLQVLCTTAVTASCALVLDKGLRAGIERSSVIIMPLLGVILVILIVRSLTLPGAEAGLQWYIGKFRWTDLTPSVMVAALGHAIFSLSLGGTFMVTYGSYLSQDDRLRSSAVWTVLGDTGSGLMAGLVIFPAVFAFGMEPASGPRLLFDIIPRVFAQMPAGALFGMLFFIGLLGAAYLSDMAAFEVLVAGVVDNSKLTRRKAIWIVSLVVWVVALVPMFNMDIFVKWDLTFGSGMQTLGALITVITAGFFMKRGELLEQFGEPGMTRDVLVMFVRYLIPAAMLAVGAWWLLTDVLGLVAGV